MFCEKCGNYFEGTGHYCERCKQEYGYDIQTKDKKTDTIKEKNGAVKGVVVDSLIGIKNIVFTIGMVAIIIAIVAGIIYVVNNCYYEYGYWYTPWGVFSF